MSAVIAITNQKGGVGKTTTSCALLAGLQQMGNRVLGIDLDPQGSLGFCLGLDIPYLGNAQKTENFRRHGDDEAVGHHIGVYRQYVEGSLAAKQTDEHNLRRDHNGTREKKRKKQ